MAVADNAGKYDLWVLGPNGFHRHFTGDLNALRAAGAAQPEIRVGYEPRRGDLHLKVRNDGERPCTFLVTAKAYPFDRDDRSWRVRVEGGEDAGKRWSLDDSGQWYDFEVKCDADPAYSRRFAGRVETGRHSVSDPAMGLADA
jgi:phospholipase C